MRLLAYLHYLLDTIQILPVRVYLDLHSGQASGSMLRGTWGAALRDVDRSAYACLFGEDGDEVSKYLFCPAVSLDTDIAPDAVDFTLLNNGIEWYDAAIRAWYVASGMGLGKSRTRFSIRAIHALTPTGEEVPLNAQPSGFAWRLSRVGFDASCYVSEAKRLIFETPTRLIVHRRLAVEPAFEDVVRAAFRRLKLLFTGNRRTLNRVSASDFIAQAHEIEYRLVHSETIVFRRWSARQQKEINMPGIVGEMFLPWGAGPFWQLLSALRWVHIGKGTVFGMGRVSLLGMEAA